MCGAGGGWAWGCVRAMISAKQARLLLIGTAETLGCLPPHSNEKPWPPLVSKVTRAYCNCTFSNGVSHARTPTPVMTITIMSLGSTGTFQSSVTLGEEDVSQLMLGIYRVLHPIWFLMLYIQMCCFTPMPRTVTVALLLKYFILEFSVIQTWLVLSWLICLFCCIFHVL